MQHLWWKSVPLDFFGVHTKQKQISLVFKHRTIPLKHVDKFLSIPSHCTRVILHSSADLDVAEAPATMQKSLVSLRVSFFLSSVGLLTFEI